MWSSSLLAKRLPTGGVQSSLVHTCVHGKEGTQRRLHIFARMHGPGGGVYSFHVQKSGQMSQNSKQRIEQCQERYKR